jgi:hypothetical protein
MGVAGIDMTFSSFNRMAMNVVNKRGFFMKIQWNIVTNKLTLHSAFIFMTDARLFG